MSEWKPFTLPMIPGVPEAMDAAGTAAGTLAGVLDVLAGLLETLAALVSMATDPLNAALSALIALIQELVDSLVSLLNSGIYFYLDKGPYFVAGQPDGLEGFLTRWEASFDDVGDRYRPQFEGGIGIGDTISAMFFLVGGDDIGELRPALSALGKLFNVPALELVETEEPILDYPASIEQGLSTPPDWSSVTLGDVLPPIEKLGQMLQRVVGMLAVGESYGKMLEDLAQLISDKAAALGLVADEIQAVVDDINSLIAAEGLYVLHVEADSIPELGQAVRDAEQPPPWSPEAYVAGVCLLGGTSGFGPVVELLGG
jgi:hypothetical protein